MDLETLWREHGSQVVSFSMLTVVFAGLLVAWLTKRKQKREQK